MELLDCPSSPPLSSANRRYALSLRSSLLILLFGATLYAVGLGSVRALTHHEVLAAQPAREMLCDGHWLIPTFVGVPRTIKPPTTGWLIAASMAIFRSDAEWVVRLPAVLAGLLTAWMIAALAARWLGESIGLLTGLVQLTCVYSVVQSRLAEADMPLTAATCAALCLFACANIDSPRGRRTDRWLPLAFYAAAALAFLFKGPISCLFIFSACLLFALLNRERQALRFLLNRFGIALFVICLIGWPVASYLHYPPILDDWKRELFGYASGQFGQKPLVFYLYTLPVELLPWTPLLILGAIHAWRQRQATSPLGKFLFCWIIPGLLILSAAKYKSAHYAYPLLPPLSLLAAGGLLIWLGHQHKNPNPRHGLVAVATVLACAAAIFLLHHKATQLPWTISLIVLSLGAGMLAVIHFEHRRQLTAELAALFLTAWLVIAGVQRFIIPFDDGYGHRADFARRANNLVPPDKTIYLMELGENQIAWYLRSPLARIDCLTDLPKQLPLRTTPLYAIGHPSLADHLRPLGTVEDLDHPTKLRGRLKEADLHLFKLTLSPISQKN